MAQWLRLQAPSSIPGQGTKIPQVIWHGKKIILTGKKICQEEEAWLSVSKRSCKGGEKRGPEMLSTEITAFHEHYATNSGENFQIRTGIITHTD